MSKDHKQESAPAETRFCQVWANIFRVEDLWMVHTYYVGYHGLDALWLYTTQRTISFLKKLFSGSESTGNFRVPRSLAAILLEKLALKHPGISVAYQW